MRKSMESALELWGGHECTIVRLGERFDDQTLRTRHHLRPDDLDRFKSLGISRLRYPILWEAVSPHDPEICDWRFADAAVERMAALEISTIAGLVHHGSGPKYTSLLATDFATGLARHASRVARRYPGIVDWTPVNEPLTTARFSALYGHWYPHLRDETCFWLALINQIDGVRLAMDAIRDVNPDARLIQTEDLGRTASTPALADQARFDNARRWTTWDLLCGRLVEGHPLHARLAALGFGGRLEAIARKPCPPDVIGINHYLTSDRFLDERLERHPPDSHGGNGRLRYADVAAVRVPGCGGGLAGAMREAHERYRLPLALTEVHNGCTREEQMRWINDAWQASRDARDDGIPVVALTAWSLVGACDWTSLLTETRGDYESGAWDVRSDPPRETALAPMLRDMAAGMSPSHPVLGQPGWWRRPEGRRSAAFAARHGGTPGPILITGATGTLGQAFAGACRLRNIPYRLTGRSELPLDDREVVSRMLDEVRPWAVVNAAGWVRVDEAEHEPGACIASNVEGALNLAAACARRGVHFTTFSSDFVFDGTLGRDYVEDDETAPLNVYGYSKAQADKILLGWGAPVLVVRTAAFFSQHDRQNFAVHVVEALREGRAIKAANDVIVTPTFVPDLVRATLDLIIDDETGLWHLTNEEPLSWYEFAMTVGNAAGVGTRTLSAVEGSNMGWTAPRPRAVSMRSARGRLLPSLDRAIAQFGSAMR